jgi:hypothetical protein
MELWNGLVVSLRQLKCAAETGTFSVQAFVEAQRQLESVPLTRTEFAAAKCRLENAKDFLRRGETGAARFELQLLARSMSTTARRWAATGDNVLSANDASFPPR